MACDGSDTAAVVIPARYVGRCFACRGVVAEGQECAWVRDLKRVWHVRCYRGVVTGRRRSTEHRLLPALPKSGAPKVERGFRQVAPEEVARLMGDPLLAEVVRVFELDPTNFRIAERGVG